MHSMEHSGTQSLKAHMSWTLMAVLSAFVFAPVMAASLPQPPESMTRATPTASVASIVEELGVTSRSLERTIQVMTHALSGPARDHAIREANRFLLEEQEMLRNLPPDLVAFAATESDYDGYVKTLQYAAQTMRGALLALDEQAPSPLRDAAIKDAHAALVATQETMMTVAPPMA